MTRRHSDQIAAITDEGLHRLSALACTLLTGADLGVDAATPDGRVIVEVLRVPEGRLQHAIIYDDTGSPDAPPLPTALPPNTRCFAVMPLKDPRNEAIALDDTDANELALCVHSSSPNRWRDEHVAALHLLAEVAAAETFLRADLGRQKRALDSADKQSLHDPLTELANRELFLDRVGMAVLRDARFHDRPFAVLSVSLDQLESIERSFGYEPAREVVRELGRRLRTVVRNYDSLARLSGADFGILLESIRDDTDAARVATRIHEALRSPIAAGLEQFMVSASVGIVLSFAGVDSPARLLQLAELARTRCKTSGARYEIFDPGMQLHAQSRLHRENELRRAVESDEFELHYQPIVSLSSGRIAHVEALLRWRHPERGLVTAGEFIGLAEETGLVVPMGWTALSNACRQVRDWRGQFSGDTRVSVSINVAAAQLRDREVTRQVDAILDDFQMSGGSINLEVTEGVLIGDPEQASRTLSHFRGRGVGIHLDDFGTGYSSLQYLHDLPLDAIKIDRGFIRRHSEGGRDVRVLATIRELARQIGVPVVVEGVETAEQLAHVRELGCEYAQGYFFSKALPPGEIAALIRGEQTW